MKINLVDIIGIFISVIIGLGLTPSVSSYANDIIEHNHSSDILIMIAPFVPVVWLVGCFAIAGAFGYHMYKGQ